jgi:hypothetical protein
VELQEKLKKKLEEKRAKKEKAEEKEVNARLRLSRAITQYGGPWMAEDVSKQLESLPSKERGDALVCQIKFHRVVLKSKGPKILFQESHMGKVC